MILSIRTCLKPFDSHRKWLVLRNIMLALMIIIVTSSCNKPNDGEKCIFIKTIFSINPHQTCSVDYSDPSLNPLPVIIPGTVSPIPTVCMDDDIKIKLGGTPVGITTWVINKINDVLKIITSKVYGTIAGNVGYKKIMGALLALVIAFYSLGVLLGITRASPYIMVTTAIKILLVYTFATNWTVFYDFFFEPLELLIGGMIKIFNNAFSPTSPVASGLTGAAASNSAQQNSFALVDGFFDMMFSKDFVALVLAMFAMGVGGAAYGAIFVMMMIGFLVTVVGAIKVFLIALIARNFLYALAPLFIIMALFKETKSLFDGWLEQVINFTLQPILLFAFLSMNLMIIQDFMIALLDADQILCKRPFISIMGWTLLSWFQFGDLAKGFPQLGDTDAMPFKMWSILSAIVMIYVMRGMALWSVELAGRVSGGISTASGVTIRGWDSLKNRAVRSIASTGGGVVGGAKGAIHGYRHGVKVNVGKNKKGQNVYEMRKGLNGAMHGSFGGMKTGANRVWSGVTEGIGKNKRASVKRADASLFGVGPRANPNAPKYRL